MRDDYELIDTTDNDCHDTGTCTDMYREAMRRNRDDAAHNAKPIHVSEKVKPNRWVHKPAGYSDAHYKG